MGLGAKLKSTAGFGKDGEGGKLGGINKSLVKDLKDEIKNPGQGGSQLGKTIGGEIGKTDITGQKKKARDKRAADETQDEADKQALDEKTSADSSAISHVSEKMKETAGKITAQNTEDIQKLKEIGKTAQSALDKLNVSTGENSAQVQANIDKLQKITAETDPRKLAENLAKEQEKITKQKMELADKTLAQSEKMSQFYEGMATSYQDIGQRYMDAVTGLQKSEKQQMQSTAMQDYAAMSAMGSQGMAAALGGGPVTGQMVSAAAGASQQAATSAYAAAQRRIQDVDQQRREMQFQMVTEATNAERANREAGASIMGQQIGIAANARSQQADTLQTGFDNTANLKMTANEQAFAHASNTYANVLTGIDQKQTYGQNLYSGTMQNAGFQAGVVGDTHELALDSLESQLAADTYSDEAGIAQREGVYAATMGMQSLSDARKDKTTAANKAAAGQVTGVIGGAVGAYFGGPAGAAAGYQAGSGLGSSMTS